MSRSVWRRLDRIGGGERIDCVGLHQQMRLFLPQQIPGESGRNHHHDLSPNRFSETNGVPISKSKFDEVIKIPKGEKPEHSSYLPGRYIQDHANEFSKGASRIVSKNDYNKYGLGKPDEWGSEFVSSKKNMDLIIKESESSKLSERLGIPKEQLENGGLLKISFPQIDIVPELQQEMNLEQETQNLYGCPVVNCQMVISKP
ncbi:hypothetical protein RJ498_002457 [Pluralibacter gergoviae]